MAVEQILTAASSRGSGAVPLRNGRAVVNAEVLRWLHGDAPDPWSGGGDGSGRDPVVLEELRRKIRGE
ncbi:MAG TPA: hypothetical protein VFJ12_02880 [Segeticoccus sp.]|nr:hypothetical protein [Segeticoccus sp.]